MPESVLVLEGVVKQYATALGVGPIDLAVQDGEFLSLLGPSGCGKTTTLHIIAGLLSPTAGRVMMAGRDVTMLEPRRRNMGLVFQNYALFPHKSIYDNVAFGLRMRKLPKPEIADRVGRMLEIVGLPGVEGRLPEQLSGGQRQRVALARALVIEPKVLLLDEPLSNLDAMLRKRMRQELRDLQQRVKITTIFVTHDQDEAFAMSDRVALLNHGKIEQLGPPEELYDTPANRFVAEFIGEANLIEGRIVRANGVSAEVEIEGRAALTAKVGKTGFRSGDRALVMIRPERLEVSSEHPDTGQAIRGRISKRVFSGERINFEIETAGGIRLRCSKPSLPRFRALELDQGVWVLPEECRALPQGD